MRWIARRLLAGLPALLMACSGAQQISPAGMPAFEVSLATDAGRMALSWHGGTLAHSAIYLRFVSDTGRPAGPVFRLSDGQRDAYEPDLQPLGDQWVVAWYEKTESSGETTAELAGIDRTGKTLWQRELSGPTRHGRNPVVRVAARDILVAWIESTATEAPAIWTARFNEHGQPEGSRRRAAPAGTDTWNLNAAVDRNGVFYVVYDARLATRSKELELVRIGPERIDYHALSVDDGYDSEYPDLALQADRAALTWVDQRDVNRQIYLFVGALGDLAGTVDTRATRVSRTAGPSVGAYLAWNGSRLGLAWCDQSSGGSEVFAQTFDADGTALSKPRQLTRGSAQSLIPSISPFQRGFAIAWNDYAAELAGRSPGQSPGQSHSGEVSSTAMLAALP